jgi:hypothetical protein
VSAVITVGLAWLKIGFVFWVYTAFNTKIIIYVFDDNNTSSLCVPVLLANRASHCVKQARMDQESYFNFILITKYS